MDWSTLAGKLLLVAPLREVDGVIEADVHILDTPPVIHTATPVPAGLNNQLGKNVGTRRYNLGRYLDGALVAAQAAEMAAALAYINELRQLDS